MANCSKCENKNIIGSGEVAVEFNCPYGVSVVLLEDYKKDFSSKECKYYKGKEN